MECFRKIVTWWDWQHCLGNMEAGEGNRGTGSEERENRWVECYVRNDEELKKRIGRLSESKAIKVAELTETVAFDEIWAERVRQK